MNPYAREMAKLQDQDNFPDRATELWTTTRATARPTLSLETSQLRDDVTQATFASSSTTLDSKAILQVSERLRILDLEEYLFVKESINFTEFYDNVVNTYELYDVTGSRLFIAVELAPPDKPCKALNCFSSLRGHKFTIQIINGNGSEILKLTGQTSPKPYFRCCRSILANIEIQDKLNTYGYVVEEPEEKGHVRCYSVQNSDSETIFYIKSTPNAGRIGAGFDIKDAEFSIYGLIGEHRVGKISMSWHDLLSKVFPSERNFGIHFPARCETRIKTVLIGAMFLIDYQFYERKKFTVGYDTWQLFDE